MPLKVIPTTCFFTFLFSATVSKYPPHKWKLFTMSLVIKGWRARVAAGRNDDAVMDNRQRVMLEFVGQVGTNKPSPHDKAACSEMLCTASDECLGMT
jgi:hypothetical protein